MKDELLKLVEEAALEAGKNSKLNIELSGKSGAACTAFLGLLAAGTAIYGIYCWHDAQINSLA